MEAPAINASREESLTIEQARAIRQLAEAYLALSEVYTDEVGDILANCGYLPPRDLMEAAHELLFVAEEKVAEANARQKKNDRLKRQEAALVADKMTRYNDLVEKLNEYMNMPGFYQAVSSNEEVTETDIAHMEHHYQELLVIMPQTEEEA